MKKEELKKLSDKELEDKAQLKKVLIGITIPILLALLFYVYRDYSSKGTFNIPLFIIALCNLTILLTLPQQLKSLQEELKNRR